MKRSRRHCSCASPARSLDCTRCSKRLTPKLRFVVLCFFVDVCVCVWRSHVDRLSVFVRTVRKAIRSGTTSRSCVKSGRATKVACSHTVIRHSPQLKSRNDRRAVCGVLRQWVRDSLLEEDERRLSKRRREGQSLVLTSWVCHS